MRRLRRAQDRHARASRRFKRRVLATGTAAAIALAAQAGLADPPVVSLTDEHQVVVGEDADRDLLTDREEFALGYRPFQSNQNNNDALDGAELAAHGARRIAQLPLESQVTSPDQIYKKEMLMFGLEMCDICGEAVNMGSILLVNPRLGLRIELPVIAVHYLEHGALSYGGTDRLSRDTLPYHHDRVDIALLLRTLELRFPYEPNDHQLSLDYARESVKPVAADVNDLDGDLLADSEELAAGLNLYDADQDDNLLPDGIQLARRCAEIIDRLPTLDPNATDVKGVYKISYMMRGLEWCEICGASVNMGYWQIVNPSLGVSMEVSEIARHFMEHGSFGYLGNVHGGGRTDVAALLKIIEWPSECGDLGTLYQPADLNQDGRVDIEDFTEFAERWLNAVEPTDK